MTLESQLNARKTEIETELEAGRIQRNIGEYADIVAALGRDGGGATQADIEAAIDNTLTTAVVSAELELTNIDRKTPELTAGQYPVIDGWRPRELNTSSPTYNASYSGYVGMPTWTVPINVEWQIQSAYFTLATDATVAARAAQLIINSTGATRLFASPARLTQAASLTYNYSFGLVPSLDTVMVSGSDNFVLVTMPPLVLKTSESIIFNVANKQAGDTFSNRGLLVMERTINTV